jgi:hypothetical protein
MGFNSIDDMVSEMTAGKTWRQDWNKLSAATAAWVVGTWNDTSQISGVPVAGTYPGATLVAQTPMDQGAGTVPSFGVWHGGNVASDTKHLVNMGAYATAATSVPGLVMLVDIVKYYPLIAMNSTTAQVLINSNTFTVTSSGGLLLTHANDFGSTISTITSVKFTTNGTLPVGLNTTDIFYIVRQGATTSKVSTSIANAIAGTFVAYDVTGMSGVHNVVVTSNRYADGAGLRCAIITQTTVTTSAASAIQDNTAVTGTLYTNQAGATGKVFGAAVTHAAFGTNIPLLTRVTHSTTAANGYGPSMPLAAGDTGIQSMQQFKLSTAYTGASQSAVVLYKPLAMIPIVTAGVAGERNLVMQLPSLPRIYDGACLANFYFNGTGLALSSALMGYIDVAWG